MGTKEDYQSAMEKQLNEWKAQMDQLKANAEQAGAQTKTIYEKQLELLRAQQDAAWTTFNNLKGASEQSWNQVKASMDKAWSDLTAATEKAFKQSK
ncbi:MAG: coiled coil domain-containing protein [Nitrososphaera sp.]